MLKGKMPLTPHLSPEYRGEGVIKRQTDRPTEDPSAWITMPGDPDCSSIGAA